MKAILGFVAVCFTAAVIGCQTSQTVSPGAISECGAKEGAACTKAKSECCGGPQCDGTAMAAVSDCATKCADKADCASKCAGQKSDCHHEKEANLGAVSEKAGCGAKSECGQKAGCSKEAEANLGAVSEKAGCGAKKAGCSKEAEANLGAVSEKVGCGAKKAGCGSR